VTTDVAKARHGTRAGPAPGARAQTPSGPRLNSSRATCASDEDQHRGSRAALARSATDGRSRNIAPGRSWGFCGRRHQSSDGSRPSLRMRSITLSRGVPLAIASRAMVRVRSLASGVTGLQFGAWPSARQPPPPRPGALGHQLVEPVGQARKCAKRLIRPLGLPISARV
jgi:hypothetical protein